MKGNGVTSSWPRRAGVALARGTVVVRAAVAVCAPLLPLLGVAGCATHTPEGAASPPASTLDPPVTTTPPLPAPPPSPADPCAPALFCDDFEDDAVGAAPGKPWRDETGPSGATVRVDTVHAHSGHNAVHVFAPKGASYRRGYFAIHEPPVFPAASQEMYGRAMVWLDEAPRTPPGEHDVHWTLLQGEGRSKGDDFNSIYRYGGQHQAGLGLMANFETTPPVKSDCWQHSESRLPVKEWACVEWHFVVARNEMEFWLNGTELEDLHVVDRAVLPGAGCLHSDDLHGQWLAPPAFQSLYLGWERYQSPENDQNVWFDDVVVSSSRVGCPE
jgi:polysaccharide lyase-like protein